MFQVWKTVSRCDAYFSSCVFVQEILHYVPYQGYCHGSVDIVDGSRDALVARSDDFEKTAYLIERKVADALTHCVNNQQDVFNVARRKHMPFNVFQKKDCTSEQLLGIRNAAFQVVSNRRS